MEMRRAVIYARFSSSNQKEESIEAQVKACTEYAEKNNMIIVKNYEDRAHTATNDRRPAFQQMIRESDKKEFDVVLVHKLDRFSRNKFDKAINKRRLNLNNVNIESVLERITDDPEGRLLESLLDGIAQYYSENLSREVMKTMMIHANNAKHLGGIPPFGYDVNEEKKYVINEDEAYAVRLIFEMYADGYGYGQISQFLNDSGYSTKKNKPFGKNSLPTLLRNEKYRGVYIYNRATKKDVGGKRNNWKSKSEDEIIKVENGMPRIISDELWDKVHKKLVANKNKGARNKAKHAYLLSGKLICAECGSRMVGDAKKSGSNKNLLVAYKCGKRDRKCKCSTKSINRNYIENYVIKTLLENVFTNANAKSFTKAINKHLADTNQSSQLRLKSCEKRIAEINKESELLLNAILSGNNSQIITDKMKKIDIEKANIDIQLEKLRLECEQSGIKEDYINSIFKKVRKDINDALYENDTDKLRIIMDAFVKEVLVNNDDVTIKFNLKDSLNINVFSEDDQILDSENPHLNLDGGMNGGGEGNRTPVQKHFTKAFSERSY